MKLNRVYKPFLDACNRYAILYGGAGSGKSHVVAQKILIRAISEKKHRFLIVRKVAKTLRASVFQMFVDLIAEDNISHKFKVNKSDMTIECIDSGSKLLFFGLDDVEKLKSIAGITGIWIEEASEIAKTDLDQLDLRLRINRDDIYMQIILSFNPISAYHWLKKEFFDIGKDDSYIQKTTYLDNRFLPEEYLKVFENLKKSNPDYYKVYALGEWGVIEGIIYDKYETVEKMPEYFEDEFIGVDFGFNHAYAVVHVRIENNNLYVDELIYESKKTNKEIIAAIKDEYPFVYDLEIYADSARPDLIREYEEDGFSIHKANKSVFDGINTVKGFNMFVTKRSQNIRKELGLYVWKTDRFATPLDEPLKVNDDALDAIRYAITPYINRDGVMRSLSLDFL